MTVRLSRLQPTIDFESVIEFIISRGILTQHREHIDEIIERHIAGTIMRKYFANSHFERIFLS